MFRIQRWPCWLQESGVLEEVELPILEHAVDEPQGFISGSVAFTGKPAVRLTDAASRQFGSKQISGGKDVPGPQLVILSCCNNSTWRISVPAHTWLRHAHCEARAAASHVSAICAHGPKKWLYLQSAVRSPTSRRHTEIQKCTLRSPRRAQELLSHVKRHIDMRTSSSQATLADPSHES